MTVERV